MDDTVTASFQSQVPSPIPVINTHRTELIPRAPIGYTSATCPRPEVRATAEEAGELRKPSKDTRRGRTSTCIFRGRERECCLLVLNLVSSTLPCIRQPRPRLRVLDICGFVSVCTQAFIGFQAYERLINPPSSGTLAFSLRLTPSLPAADFPACGCQRYRAIHTPKSKVQNRAAYPDPPPVILLPESIAAQAPYQLRYKNLNTEYYSWVSSGPKCFQVLGLSPSLL